MYIIVNMVLESMLDKGKSIGENCGNCSLGGKINLARMVAQKLAKTSDPKTRAAVAMLGIYLMSKGSEYARIVTDAERFLPKAIYGCKKREYFMGVQLCCNRSYL